MLWLNFEISPNFAASDVKQGDGFYAIFFSSLSLNAKVKKIIKISLHFHICPKNNSDTLLWTM